MVYVMVYVLSVRTISDRTILLFPIGWYCPLGRLVAIPSIFSGFALKSSWKRFPPILIAMASLTETLAPGDQSFCRAWI